MSKQHSQCPEGSEQYVPQQIDRYVIKSFLGRGGFGVVYLAHDPVVNRPVALKVPRRDRFKCAKDVDRFVEEARTAGRLKHPSLIAVYDVQQHGELPYIVQEYIEGKNLCDWAAEFQPSFERIARILLGVAEAIGVAHQQGLTHCDLKLANVLMDLHGQPHVADFGLAIDESVQPRRKSEVFGTPATMAPEQVRGESHRFDDRTDIWAIGVMLYELLVGRRPFVTSDLDDLFDEIKHHDPKPPRQIDRTVPKELERICLKCLSKRRSGRYNTTDDLRDDLCAWLDQQESSTQPQETSTSSAAQPDSSSRSMALATIIPKGLRSFDAGDADFFLELLPGPRDREGLPDSLRFWKTRIEQTDSDETFSVGLIYGPSGCGKSSLVKAGLLPRLGDDVLPIYVEATADDTEARIVKQLRKHCPNVFSSDAGSSETEPADTFDLSYSGESHVEDDHSFAPTSGRELSLSDACAILRLTGAGRNRKVLLVIDQFEQWLHAHADLNEAPLVDALRQCEGGRLQAVLMVRDDFYLSVNRVFQELDVCLLEGENYFVVDRFNKDHACKVLTAFGIAYGKIGEIMTVEQEQFIQQAVDELAEDNRVISVRLSLFADMMQSRDWHPKSLKEIGGVGGVGVTFLEETFSAKSAPPSHRVHEKAFRSMLGALLPQAVSDIKGATQSVDTLRNAAGYHERPKLFEELIQILDGELRLITPADPNIEAAGAPAPSRHYQLTHDYLVPSLREWLTQKQRATRRGRAQLRLIERSVLYSATPEARHLPPWWEYLNLRLLTDSKEWTSQQQEMLSTAARVHAVRWGMALAVLLAVGILIQQYLASASQRNLADRIQQAVASMSTARGILVPRAIDDLQEIPEASVLVELRKQFANGEQSRKLALAYALADFGDVDLEFLLPQIDNAPADECDNIVAALANAKQQTLRRLLESANQADRAKNWRVKGRLAVVALHLGDSTIAVDINRLKQPDPTQQTVFIHESFPKFHGDLERLAALMQNEKDPGLRYGISLAIGKLIELHDAQQPWQQLLSAWYRQAPDSATHSAAGWALRQLQVELPIIPNQSIEADTYQWQFTDHGFTLIRIPSGSFQRQDPAEQGIKQTVTLTKGFWLSDREVTVKNFQEFIDDEQYQGLKPDNWLGADKKISPTRNHPVQKATWEHAAMFCNWLSAKEGLGPVFEFVRLDHTRGEWIVTIRHDASGYRLPTEAEWEHACRADATTEFCFGNDLQRLHSYAVVRADNAETACSRMCNRRGLFDMHGNVWECCLDWYAVYVEKDVQDPRGPSKRTGRIVRGGSWGYAADNCHAGYRRWYQPSVENFNRGFRVARNL